MTALIIAIHIIACSLLIILILIQAGRGGGLVSGFSGIESMFGTKTNTFLTKTTAILSVMFFITCLSLAVLSARKSKSIMHNAPIMKVQTAAAPEQANTPAATAATTPTAPAEQQTAPAAQATPAQNTANATNPSQ